MSYRSDNTSRGGGPSGMARELAYGLGWFSIGLGAMEVLAPGTLARTLGMRGSETLIRAYGMREIANGVAILASDDPTAWVWTRVGGDALDIATLASAYDDSNPQRGNVGLALAAVAGVTALAMFCAAALSAGGGQVSAAWGGGEPERVYDYSDRSGLPRPPGQMRGAASDFQTPRDYRAPDALQRWDRPGSPASGAAEGSLAASTALDLPG